MFRIPEVRRALASLALVALLAPGPAFAQAPARSGGTSSDTLVGAFMSAACGAGINVNTTIPTPIGITVTAVCCFLMMVDAIASQDPN